MTDIKKEIREIANEFEKNYALQNTFSDSSKKSLPVRSEIYDLIDEIRRLMFPGFFGHENSEYVSYEHFAGNTISRVYEKLLGQIADVLDDVDSSRKITLRFLRKLPSVQDKLMKDVQAEFDGDPAASCLEEIIISYPGIYAIFVYRIAHELYLEHVPFIPRIMSELAHNKTGIDINPGAEIGEYFFIDHGTGIVIGETTVIGDHVKLYQGVTLGALSTGKGQLLKNTKRHPTIENNVVIYANTTVLGGDTVIGENSVIAGNTFVTESIPRNTKVFSTKPELTLKNRR